MASFHAYPLSSCLCWLQGRAAACMDFRHTISSCVVILIVAANAFEQGINVYARLFKLRSQPATANRQALIRSLRGSLHQGRPAMLGLKTRTEA